MSQQRTVNAYFQARKRAQPTSGKRKSLAVRPSSLDPATLEPKSPKTDKHCQHASARQAAKGDDEVPAEKPLIIAEAEVEAVFTTPRKILTPRKVLTPGPVDNCLPSKLASAAEKASRSAKKALFKDPEPLIQSPKKSPADVRKVLGSTNSLATLQARLKSLSHASPVHAKKALFRDDDEEATVPLSPKLSRKGLDFEVEGTKAVVVLPSPHKASPRKQALEAAAVVEDKVRDLLQPSDLMPLPQSYRELAAIFRKVDELAAIKYNRKQSIPVAAIKADVQIAMRKALTDAHLKQIRCVFPKAFDFTWEFAKDSRNRNTSKYELYLSPNVSSKILPRDLVERQKLFNHHLLTIVQDHHQEFLRTRGISGLGNERIHKWDKEFDVDRHCLKIDELDFPDHPVVESPERNPQLMLEKITGANNQSMEKALAKVVDISTPSKSPAAPTVKPEEPEEEDVRLDPALRDLPPHLIAKIKAQERERRIREVAMDKGEQKQLKMLEELLHNRFFSTLVNCHNTLRKGKAVPYESLCARTADSSGKSKDVVQELLKLFMQTCPEVFATKTYNKVEQVLGNYNKAAPDFDRMEKALEASLSKLKTG